MYFSCCYTNVYQTVVPPSPTDLSCNDLSSNAISTENVALDISSNEIILNESSPLVEIISTSCAECTTISNDVEQEQEVKESESIAT